MSDGHRVNYETRDKIAYIMMNRPPVNAIDNAMVRALHAALKRAAADKRIRAIVIGSAIKGVFSGGMDLHMAASSTSLQIRDFLRAFYIGTMDIQYELPKPVIASINGPARGAGMTVAITCDVVLAADDIDLAYPEIDVGQIPAIHYVHLPRQISRHKAFELLFGGLPIAAAEACELGLINRLTPRDELESATHSMACLFAEKSPTVMALSRQSFLRANDLDYRRNIENQIETFCNVFATDDGREGIKAFVEKRQPLWHGD